MKNYIRTKDGVYEFQYDNENENSLIKEVVVLCDGELTCLNKRKIIDQADTIEELCDEYVCENSLIDSSPRKEGGRIVGKYHKVDNARMLAQKGLTVYGSIWVDGNLIKVAKMNEKGELKLL